MESQKAMIRALTWNVGGTDPRDEDESKKEIISSVTQKICDGLKDGALLVIGIQEVIPPDQSSNRIEDTVTRTREWAKRFEHCDSRLCVLKNGEMSHASGVSLILLTCGKSNFSVTKEGAIFIGHEEGRSHEDTINATIGTQISFGGNNDKILSISVSHLPAYSSTESEYYRLRMRDECIEYALKKIHKEFQDILWIGDMNYWEGVAPDHNRGGYDLTNDALFRGINYNNADRNKALRSLSESSIDFNATHIPGKQHKVPYEYAFTDRILFACSSDKSGLSPIATSYTICEEVEYRFDVSNHRPVTQDFEFGGGKVPGKTECRICGLPMRTVV